MQVEGCPIVYIEWEDCQGEGDVWIPFDWDELKKDPFVLQKCVSVGWLVRENKETIWLIPHLCLKNPRDDSYSRFGGVFIPKSQVTKRVVLVEETKPVHELTSV